MTPVLITPPAAEPVSLAEARLYLKIDGAEEDTLIAALVSAARLTIEAASGRLLLRQVWRLSLHRWPPSARLFLPLSPVLEIVEARVATAAGSEVAAAEALELVAGSDPPELRLAGAVPHPAVPRGGIEIDLAAGYGAEAADVPATLRQAMLRLVAFWFERRGEEPGRPHADWPAEIGALIGPHRRARL